MTHDAALECTRIKKLSYNRQNAQHILKFQIPKEMTSHSQFGSELSEAKKNGLINGVKHFALVTSQNQGGNQLTQIYHQTNT